jgi:putative pyruvate formate lyase activating enzyme
LPDLKYVTPAVSKKFSNAEDYFAFAAPALMEMYRQAGDLRLNENGVAISGLVIRHLVLPGCLDETRKVLDYISEAFPKGTWISLMRQYTPMTDGLPSPLNRRLTAREYERAVSYCLQLGFTNVLLQEEDAADSSFTPAFYESLCPSS